MTLPRLIAAAAVVIVLGMTLLLVVWQRGTDGVLVGVHVGDRDVSGMSRDELPDVVAEQTQDSLAEPVVVVGVRSEIATDREAAGARADTASTVEAAWRRGRQRNPLAAFADHAAARMGRTIRIEPAEQVDEDAVREWADSVAAGMSQEPRNAGIRFAAGPEPPEDDEASRVVVSEPAPGETVDSDDLASRAIDALRAGGPVELEAPAQTQQPEITQSDLDAVLPQARQAVSTPMKLRNPSDDAPSLDLVPADLAAVLVTRADPDAPEVERLSIGVDPEQLQRRLAGDRIEAIEGNPGNARFVVDGNRVRIRGGRTGYNFNAQAVATRMEDLIAEGRSEGTLPGDPVVPNFTRADAQKLEINRRVSEFTTEHACCKPRVTNIQRMADIVDGAIIRPDETFSLNGHVGPRTRDKGFVDGGVIVEGEFEEAVGGGVSQFATTFFNAALFSGIDIHDFQPHSYYISRYPIGHESTLNYGSIDVEIHNDSPYGILIKTSYTDTSITVTFYSSPWAEVDVDVGPRRNIVDGDIRDGFDVSWTRTVTYPNGREEVEEYFHRYEPENESDDDD